MELKQEGQRKSDGIFSSRQDSTAEFVNQPDKIAKAEANYDH
jgi:hypothetical protein